MPVRQGIRDCLWRKEPPKVGAELKELRDPANVPQVPQKIKNDADVQDGKRQVRHSVGKASGISFGEKGGKGVSRRVGRL